MSKTIWDWFVCPTRSHASIMRGIGLHLLLGYWYTLRRWALNSLEERRSVRTPFHILRWISLLCSPLVSTYISYIHYYVCCVHFGIQVLCYACVLCSNYLHYTTHSHVYKATSYYTREDVVIAVILSTTVRGCKI